MRSLEIVLAFRAAEPIPRASRKLCWRFYAALMFGSRNSMSLCGCCVGLGKFWQRETVRQDRSASFFQPVTPNQVPSPLDMLSRIPKASLDEPSGEGTTLLVCRISKHVG
jgi:hypothetical protein